MLTRPGGFLSGLTHPVFGFDHVAVFAIFHGHAHGTELPEAANPIPYAVGFVVATGCLHLLGIVIGLIHRWLVGAQALRAGGMAILGVGVYFLVPHLG